MLKGLGRRTPALVIAGVALFAALGGTVYAAARIDGHSIKPKSMPGNRLALGSVPANRLQGRGDPGQPDRAGIDHRHPDRHRDAGPGADRGPRRHGRFRPRSGLGADRRQRRRRGQGQRPHGGMRRRHPRLRRRLLADRDAARRRRRQPTRRSPAPTRAASCPSRCSWSPSRKEPGITLAPGDEWTEDIPSCFRTECLQRCHGLLDGEVNSAALHLNQEIPLRDSARHLTRGERPRRHPAKGRSTISILRIGASLPTRQITLRRPARGPLRPARGVARLRRSGRGGATAASRRRRRQRERRGRRSGAGRALLDAGADARRPPARTRAERLRQRPDRPPAPPKATGPAPASPASAPPNSRPTRSTAGSSSTRANSTASARAPRSTAPPGSWC